MDYDLYRQAVRMQRESPADEALAPYWDQVIEIWRSNEPIRTLSEIAVEIKTESLVLATGGPHVELTSKGYLRGRWGRGWIISEPSSTDQEEASRYVRSLLSEDRLAD